MSGLSFIFAVGVFVIGVVVGNWLTVKQDLSLFKEVETGK